MTVLAFLLGCSLFWWCLFLYVLRHLTLVDRACLRAQAAPGEHHVESHLRKTRVLPGQREEPSILSE